MFRRKLGTNGVSTQGGGAGSPTQTATSTEPVVSQTYETQEPAIQPSASSTSTSPQVAASINRLSQAVHDHSHTNVGSASTPSAPAAPAANTTASVGSRPLGEAGLTVKGVAITDEQRENVERVLAVGASMGADHRGSVDGNDYR